MKPQRAIACAVTTLCVMTGQAAYADDVSYVIDTPILSSLSNFRDIAGLSTLYGGTGYSNSVANDGVMRTGVFYRSNALSSLTAADSATLTSLGITAIYDLRTSSEISTAVDASVSGATYTNIDILGSAGNLSSASSITSVAAADSYMTSMYTTFVSDSSVRSELKTLLLALATTDGASLYHCTAGKDRTGWASVILESIAGVSSTQIMADYLATNDYSAASIAATRAQILAAYTSVYGVTTATAIADAYAELMSVNATWLQAALDEVTAEYGTMQNYLLQGLGLTMADIYVLRAKMVYYNSLPGQAGMTGNAAAGARLLQNLQNSTLSGHYTSFNYFLQSAIDNGTLDGMASRVGGQVHADATAVLMSQPRAVDAAMRSHVNPDDPRVKPVDPVWVSVWNNNTRADGASGSASATSHDYGVLFGITRPLNDRVTVYGALGNATQRSEAAGATGTISSMQIVGGARVALGGEDSSTFFDGSVFASQGTYDSQRNLGDGLGTARGGSHNWLVSARGAVGHTFEIGDIALTPQAGLRFTQSRMSGFEEYGSELALNMQGVSKSQVTARAAVDVNFRQREWGAWTFSPVLTLGYEQSLNSPTVTTTGAIQGYTVSQNAAFDTRMLGTAELSLKATRGPVTADVRVAVGAGEHGLTSIGTYGSLRYTFF